MFQSLPPAQQQALIRELQQELPPAQRQAILRILQSGAEPGEEELAPGEEGDEEEGALDFPSERFDLREVEEPRFAPGSTVVVQFSVPEDGPELDADLAATRQDLLDRLARGNPYTLDGSGQLLLPGIPPIALSGLNEDEATVRVGAEPALRNLVAELTLLPLEPVGFYALKPFGYDLFERSPSTFAPATDIPVPADYVIGPSDTVYVQLFGNQNTEYFLTVSREGVINFPEIGPLSVSGLTFPDMRTMINERITRANDRRACEHHARRAAVDSYIRAGRSHAARLVHGQRSLDDDQRALRERRRPNDRIAAEYRAQARRRHDLDARPV